MRIAVIGSRSITGIDLKNYLPENTKLIISGGAKGMDQIAKDYAKTNRIALLEILPDYAKYQRRAPLIRNLEIIKKADKVIAFWDGKSKGTKFVIDNCAKAKVECEVIQCQYQIR